jgi:hypothetical protein
VLVIADVALSGVNPLSSIARRLGTNGLQMLDGRIWKARKPKEGCRITPSIFCPQVHASDHLGLWKTQHGELYTNSIE